MPALSKDETIRFSGETEVLDLLHELGLSDWPAHHVEEGVLVRGVSHHETHWLVFLCLAAQERSDWLAFGFPKSKFTYKLAEEILAITTAEFGAKGPFFQEAY